MSVTVPVFVPSIRIEAPIIGSSSSFETTVPEMEVCANAMLVLTAMAAATVMSLFSINLSLFKKINI